MKRRVSELNNITELICWGFSGGSIPTHVVVAHELRRHVNLKGLVNEISVLSKYKKITEIQI